MDKSDRVAEEIELTARAAIEDGLPALKKQMDERERLRAENAAQAKQIETLREALEHAASYMVTLCMDRPVQEDGEVVGHWQTVDWLIGMRELAEESHAIALASLPPSDMRLVSAKRLERLEDALVRFFAIQGSPVGEGWAAETLGTDIITLNIRVAEMPPSDMAIVSVKRLREIRDCFESIKRHLSGNESALGTAILATCDTGLEKLAAAIKGDAPVDLGQQPS